MNGKVFLWPCFVLFVVACQLQAGPEFTESPQAEPLVAIGPQVGNIVSIGEPERVDLRPTTETVRNCTGSIASVTKNPTMATLTGHNIEWAVNGELGFGATIGEGVIPFGIDLSSTLERTVGESVEQSISQSVSWNLPAAPGEIVEYTLDWWELWQPGYVDVTMADKVVVRVNLSYRTGIQSEIADGIAYDCNGQIIGVATVPPSTPYSVPQLAEPTQIPVPVIEPTQIPSTQTLLGIPRAQVNVWNVGDVTRDEVIHIIYDEIQQFPGVFSFSEGDTIPEGVLITADLGINWNRYPLQRLAHDGGGWGVFESTDSFVVLHADDLPGIVGGQYWYIIE